MIYKNKIRKFSKQITPSEVKYKIIVFSRMHVEEIFGIINENIPLQLVCTDGDSYSVKIDKYGRIYATEFYKKHNWLKGGCVIDFEIDSEKNIVKVNITNKQIEQIEQIEEKEFIIPEYEKQVRDILADKIKKDKFENLKLYKGIEGVEYNTNQVGVIDILCKDNNGDFVVIELKKERSSDAVVGQIQRYMGWVKENLAQDKDVRGIIIWHRQKENSGDLTKLLSALKVNPKISLKFYELELKISD